MRVKLSSFVADEHFVLSKTMGPKTALHVLLQVPVRLEIQTRMFEFDSQIHLKFEVLLYTKI